MMILRNLILKRTYQTNSNTIQWNKMIKNYQLNGNYQQALKLFQVGLEKQTFQPDANTYLTLLDICKQLKSLSTLRTIHQLIDSSKQYPDISKNSHIRSLLMDVYIKCNDIDSAYHVFKTMNEKNLIDYCGLMTGFNQQKQYDKTFELSKDIPLSIKYSSPILCTLILQACTYLKRYDDGHKIHQNIKKDFISKDKMLRNELINFYLKFYQEKQALEIFNQNQNQQTIIDYTIFMKYYNRIYQPDKTIQLYYHLKNQSSIQIDHIIYVLVLQAIANGCCLHTSQQILNDIKKFGTHIDIENALINMYGKLGDLDRAEKMFHSMSKHNIVSYNVLLNVYGLYRQSDKALKLYNQMCQQGHRPDDKTYVLLLHTLSQNSNKINDVKRIFSSIEENKRGPMLTAAMIAALVRANLYDEVNVLLKKLPKENILYYAIKSNENDKLNQRFSYPTLITNEQLALYDLLMSNIYTYAGIHDQMTIIDELLYDNKILEKLLSYSWFEKSNGKVEYFRNDDSQLKNCEHTEKDALQKALEDQKDYSSPILIGKNQQICTECHNYFKKISFSSFQKNIYLRDSTHFHLFSSGTCSCEVSS